MLQKITAILLICIISTTMCFAYDNNPIINQDYNSIVEDKPAPEFFDDFDYDYDYDYRDDRPISLQVNGEMVEFDVAPKSFDDTTYAQTEKLALALNISADELDSKEIDGVKMSPVRASVDKKGYSTYWLEWQKTIVVIDIDGIVNDFKASTSNFCELFKKYIKIPENGEYIISSKLDYKVDGGKNGFNLFAGADLKGNIKVEQNKISGDLTLEADGLYKLYSMIANSFVLRPDGPINFKFYIDDSGIYYKSAFINKMMFEGYYLSDEFKNNSIDKWIKVGFDEIGIEDFKTVNSIRTYDADLALNQYINTLIFDDMNPKEMYLGTYTYKYAKEKSENLKKYMNNNYLTFKDNKYTFKYTEKDLKWSLEDWKKQIEEDSYTSDTEKQANITLLDRLIDSIKGEYKVETDFKNNILDKSTTNLKLEATIPFYYNQQICTVSVNCMGGTNLINLGKTVISDTAPSDFITNEQLEEADKYDLENYEAQDQEL